MRLPDLSDLIADLQLAKDIAIRNENANSLVTATLAQAKLFTSQQLCFDFKDDVYPNYNMPLLFATQNDSESQ